MPRGLCAAALAPAVALAVVASAGAFTKPPKVEASAVFVQNGSNGDVLLRHRDRARVPIASITKLMTVLVTLERTALTDVVTVPASATLAGGSTIYLRAGEQLTVRDLVEAALIQSANDAAGALAAHVGGGSQERFVGLMNVRARQLGLPDTHFVRPDGLDVPGHVSSARDVTKLARIVMRKAVVRQIVRRRSDTISGGRTLHTWNDLLGSFPGVLGVKTGHTAGAGWSQVAAARGPGFTIYATLLGSRSRSERNQDLAGLLTWALGRYRPVALVTAGHVYARTETEYGRDRVPLVAMRPLVRVVRVDRPLRERVIARAAVALPVTRGQRLGEVRVYDGSRMLGSRPLVAARSVSGPGVEGRVAWYTGEVLDRMWGWMG